MTTPVNIAKARKMIVACVKANQPFFLHGKPGIGKSDLVQQVALSLSYAEGKGKRSYGLIDWRAVYRDPVDLRGLPVPNLKDGTTIWLKPSELPQVERDGRCGLFFMDELTQASQMMKNCCFGVVLNRKFGEHPLLPGWLPCGAGNYVTDRAGATRLPTALANRFENIYVDIDPAPWVEWASANNVHPVVVAYIRWRPEMLHVMPKGDEDAFPTPRSIVSVSNMLDHIDDDIRQAQVAGACGDAWAAEFEGFWRIHTQLPSMDDIQQHPRTARVPEETEVGALFAVATALGRHSNAGTFAAHLEYAQRLPKEFEVIVATDAIRREPALQKTRAFGQWAARNQEVML